LSDPLRALAAASLAIFLGVGLALPAIATAGPGGATRVTATGRAAIANGDAAAARLEAIARARWEAVQQVAGVEIQSASLVVDFTVLDDTLLTRAAGVVASADVVSESCDGRFCTVAIRAEVEANAARRIVSGLARNTAIAVYLPVRMADGSLRESNPLSETVSDRLVRGGYEVVDLAERRAGFSEAELRRAIDRGDFSAIQSVLHRFLTGIVIVGVAEVVRTGEQGADVGYGRLPFDIVTAHVDYRVVGAPEGELRSVLASGHERGKGGGSSVAQAALRSLEELAEVAAGPIVEGIARHVRAVSRRVSIAVDGVDSLPADRTVREILQSIAWVHDVSSVRMGHYIVEYPEDLRYLAASLENKPGLRVTDYDEISISAHLDRTW
jgi:hypothetical protein